MTTNFDFLIEYALIQLGVLQSDIIPVITEHNFRKYNNPSVWYKQEKRLIYKIHGSTKNIITGKSTRNSLIATIKGFGLNKGGMNVFQIEPFKRQLFDNITKNRSLVVMGYSGSDDFDIVPTLMVLEDLKHVFWINHVNDPAFQNKIYEINSSNNQYELNSEKIEKILTGIKNMNPSISVYRIDAYTSNVVKKVTHSIPDLRNNSSPVSIDQWMKKCIKTHDKFMKYLIPFLIYCEFNKNQEALRIGNKLIEISKRLNFISALASVNSYIGVIYINLRNYNEAIKYLKSAMSLHKKIGDPVGISNCLTNIGNIYLNQNRNDLALKYYKKTLKKINNMEYIVNKAHSLSKPEKKKYIRRKYPKVYNWIKITHNLLADFDFLFEKAHAFNKIAEVYSRKKKFHLAINYLKKAIKIAEKLGGLNEKATFISNLGFNYFMQKKYNEAIEQYKEAFKIAEELGDIYGKYHIRDFFGVLYREQGNYTKALKYFTEALLIAEGMNDKLLMSDQYNCIGETHVLNFNFPLGIENFEKAHVISEKEENLAGKARFLHNMGNTYHLLGEKTLALKYLDDALHLLETIGSGNTEDAQTIKKSIEDVKRNVGLIDYIKKFMNQ